MDHRKRKRNKSDQGWINLVLTRLYRQRRADIWQWSCNTTSWSCDLSIGRVVHLIYPYMQLRTQNFSKNSKCLEFHYFASKSLQKKWNLLMSWCDLRQESVLLYHIARFPSCVWVKLVCAIQIARWSGPKVSLSWADHLAGFRWCVGLQFYIGLHDLGWAFINYLQNNIGILAWMHVKNSSWKILL